MNSEKEAVWSVTSLPGWWDWGVSSQDPGVSRASGAAVGLVVVGVESTSWSWATRSSSCSPGSEVPS